MRIETFVHIKCSITNHEMYHKNTTEVVEFCKETDTKIIELASDVPENILTSFQGHAIAIFYCSVTVQQNLNG